MASIISAGTTSGTSLNLSGDTSGVLQLASNGSTTAVTIDTSQNTTFAQTINAPNTFGFKNRIINGAMVIDQRNAGAAVTVNAASDFYAVDRFVGFGQATDGVYTLQQSTVAPAGFTNSLLATVTTADASVGASQYYFLQQRIEGLNVAELGFGTASAKIVTLSFWVRSSLTGTFGGSLTNGGFNRAYPFTYTISAANTWEQKSITIAGDTTGTWLTNTGIGLRVYWDLGSGSDNVGAAGSWLGAGEVGATGGTRLISTLGATLYITGVQLEVGSTATSFDYLDYGRQLIQCQRYYYKIKASGTSFSNLGTGYNTATTTANFMVFFPVTLRIRPTALETSGTASDYAIAYEITATDCSVVPTYSAPTNEFIALVIFTVASGLTAGQGSRGCSSLNNANAFLAWSAEL
jgi:hypothetical protein